MTDTRERSDQKKKKKRGMFLIIVANAARTSVSLVSLNRFLKLPERVQYLCLGIRDDQGTITYWSFGPALVHFVRRNATAFKTREYLLITILRRPN